MNSIPQKLYKYHPAKVGLSVLRNSRIRFTPPIEFNDPFDQNPAHDVSSPTLLKLAADRAKIDFAFRPPGPITPRQYEKYLEAQTQVNYEHAQKVLVAEGHSMPSMYQKMFSQRFGVYCLTEHASSLLMWAHYTESHKGCVIEMNLADKHQYTELRGLKKVAYHTERPLTGPDIDPYESVYRKGMEWSYEDEWRMLAHVGDLPHKENEMWFDSLPPNTITGVYIGCKAPDQIVEEFRIAAREMGLQPGRLFKMRPDPTQFQLHPDTIQF